MSAPVTGTETTRPFLPAKDFELSKRFYQAIGFELLHEGTVAIFGMGNTSFILQNFHQKEWAENFMMQLMVDDLDAWWVHLQRLNLSEKFPSTSLRPPQMQPWGLRIAYLVDPSGVLWHVAERRPDVVHDR